MRRLLLLGLACCGRMRFDPTQGALDGSAADGTSDSSSAGTPALVQAQTQLATGSTIGLPIEPTQAGSLLVIMMSSIQTVQPVTSVDDDAGNTYVSANLESHATGLSADAEMWYASSAKPGATVVSVTSQASVMRGLWFVEVGGAAGLALDQGMVLDDGMQVTTVMGPAITPSRLPAAIVTIAVVSGNISGLAPPTQFIGLPPQHGDDSAYALVATPGTYSAVWNATGTGPYCSAIAAFSAP